ncbi:MAG: SH3 domain-containing protein, partial [Myxococcota bacterium]
AGLVSRAGKRYVGLMLLPDLLGPTALRRPLAALAGATGLLVSLGCAGLFPSEPPTLPEPAPVAADDDMLYFYVPGDHDVEDAKFSEWKNNDKLYIGVHDVNLRASSDTSSEVLRELPLGMQVTILEKGDTEILTQRRNRWYRVRTPVQQQGWVFGAVLSPVRVMLQGAQEGDAPAVVTFNPDFAPRVRVRDPNRGEAGKEWSLDVKPTDEFVGGVLDATAEPIGNDVQLVVEQCDAASGRCGTARVRIVDDELVAVD